MGRGVYMSPTSLHSSSSRNLLLLTSDYTTWDSPGIFLASSEALSGSSISHVFLALNSQGRQAFLSDPIEMQELRLRVLLLPASVLASLWLTLVGAQLTFDFYKTTCPNVDAIVTNTIMTMSKKDNVVPPAVLRLYFHDCLVEGCDGSILISSTPTNVAERDAADNRNFPQNGFDAIVESKKAVEAACPGVVSCADILAMAARDAVVFSGGPRWAVPKGRRDGLISRASRVEGHLPGSGFNISQLVSIFSGVNLSIEDLVVLSGAHTIGFSHCNQFTKRLYNFSSTVKTDPSMEPSFVASLKAACPQTGGNPNTVHAFDATTAFAFDNSYYLNLQRGKGLLFSDQVLANDRSTRDIVANLATSQDDFFFAFMQVMVKLGYTGIKTGLQGEIRRDCRGFNGRVR